MILDVIVNVSYIPTLVRLQRTPITSSLCDNLCLLWEKSGFIVTRYPLSVTSGRCAPEDKSLMAGGGEHLLGIRTSIPLFTNY